MEHLEDDKVWLLQAAHCADLNRDKTGFLVRRHRESNVCEASLGNNGKIEWALTFLILCRHLWSYCSEILTLADRHESTTECGMIAWIIDGHEEVNFQYNSPNTFDHPIIKF